MVWVERDLQRLSSPNPPAMGLNPSRDGASTSPLGNLFLCFTILTIKNFFFISNLNLPSFSSKVLPLVLSSQALVRSPSLIGPL